MLNNHIFCMLIFLLGEYFLPTLTPNYTQLLFRHGRPKRVAYEPLMATDKEMLLFISKAHAR